MAGRSRVVQADQAKHFLVQDDGNDEQRAGTEALRKEAHFVIDICRGSVVKYERLLYVDVLGKRCHVNRNSRVQTRRDIFRRAPLVTDAKLAFRRQLDDVAPIHFHHPAQFGNDNLQKRIQID